MVEFRIARGVTPNFHQGVVRYADRTLAVICAREQALLAVAEPRHVDGVNATEVGPLTFVDAPALTAVLAEQSAVRVLAAADLMVPFDPADWPTVSPDDVMYWKPATIGEALFNHWD